MKFEQILGILQALGGLGIPSSATVGAIAAITLKWLREESERRGQTEEQLLTHMVGTAEANALELLKDQARLAEETGPAE